MGKIHLPFQYLVHLALHFVFIHVTVEATVFNVINFGAVGNGVKDDTQAFVSAWNMACQAPSSILVVPSKMTFLVNNLAFMGQCSKGFTMQMDGTLVAPADPNAWIKNDYWLLFQNLQFFSLTGSGTIDGKGAGWWARCKDRHCSGTRRPWAMHFENSTNLVIKGIKVVNSPSFHITLNHCHRVQIYSVTISAPEESLNTDGIDFGDATDFLIQDCVIGTGDDCIAGGTGIQNIRLRNITCGPGHGISIGALGPRGTTASVSGFHVYGAKFIGSRNGLRIKSWQGGSGLVQNITYENVEMLNVSNPIILDQYYCGAPGACPNQTMGVHLDEITYRNIRGTSATSTAVKLMCSETVGCTNIRMIGVDLKVVSGGETCSFCVNAHGSCDGTVNPPSCLIP